MPWLEDPVTVGYLCSVRARRDYLRCLEAREDMALVPKGTAWVALSQKDMRGRLLPLQPQTIATIVKNRAAAGGLRVTKSEGSTAEDKADALAGHFLRGHAGSVAYTLATVEGASWDPMLGVDRARHTLVSFQRSYSRGVVPRLIAAFNRHSRKGKLRFEEASRL